MYSKSNSVFYVAALIAGKTIGRYIRASNEKNAQNVILNIWDNAEISLVEYIGPNMPQDNKALNFFYDKAAHDENSGMQNALI